MTGRPETLRTRSTFWKDQDWRTLHVDPFDESRQRQFLGDELAARLVLAEDERLTIAEIAENANQAIASGANLDVDAVLALIRRRQTDSAWQAEIDRKQQWADLLEVPLLLKLIRDSAELEDVPVARYFSIGFRLLREL